MWSVCSASLVSFIRALGRPGCVPNVVGRLLSSIVLDVVSAPPVSFLVFGVLVGDLR